jgi:hypothetical protein
MGPVNCLRGRWRIDWLQAPRVVIFVGGAFEYYL